MSIVTLTPNPSLDRTLQVSRLVRGSVQRVSVVRVDPGGKGVNVARALARHGLPCLALLPAAGPEGHHLQSLLQDAAVDAETVRTVGATRTNTAVVESDGTTTKLNEPGPELSPADAAALLGLVRRRVSATSWLVASGSLPPGAPTDFYARVVRECHTAGARAAVDTSGAPLQACLEAEPDLVAPNHEELAEWCGETLDTLGAVSTAARALRSAGARSVVVTLGGHGAFLSAEEGEFFARPDAVAVRSTVGAGDALLAGLLSGEAVAPGPADLSTGVVWGAAAATLPGTQMPGPDDVAKVDVRLEPPHWDLDLSPER